MSWSFFARDWHNYYFVQPSARHPHLLPHRVLITCFNNIAPTCPTFETSQHRRKCGSTPNRQSNMSLKSQQIAVFFSACIMLNASTCTNTGMCTIQHVHPEMNSPPSSTLPTTNFSPPHTTSSSFFPFSNPHKSFFPPEISGVLFIAPGTSPLLVRRYVFFFLSFFPRREKQ